MGSLRRDDPMMFLPAAQVLRSHAKNSPPLATGDADAGA
jgi:hypothetical protein